ncbi:MAG: hypothetical protein CMH26_09120 [Micavibrio sp.]|nr:hypothetical protein [Micavibrio sp.]|tara:strand:+ start:273 stop:713 length:441 start_codon:yes stop_codon:yes gene_type:complete
MLKHISDLFNSEKRAENKLDRQITAVDELSLRQALDHYNAYSNLFNTALTELKEEAALYGQGVIAALTNSLDNYPVVDDVQSASIIELKPLIQHMLNTTDEPDLDKCINFINQNPPEEAAVSDIIDLKTKLKHSLIAHSSHLRSLP